MSKKMENQDDKMKSVLSVLGKSNGFPGQSLRTGFYKGRFSGKTKNKNWLLTVQKNYDTMLNCKVTIRKGECQDVENIST